MSYIKKYKSLSIRTQLVLFLVAILAVLNICVFLLYPQHVRLTKITSINEETEKIIVSTGNILQFKNGNYRSNDAFLTDLVATLELLPNIKFIYGYNRFHAFGGPSDTYPRKMIETLAQDDAEYINKSYILAVHQKLENLPQKGSAEVIVGVSAESVLDAESSARYLAAAFLLFSAIFTYLFTYFFDTIFYFPLKRILNNSHLLSIGQQSFEEKSNFALEFNEILAHLNSIAKMNMALKEQLHKIPISNKQLKRQYEIKHKNLDRELKALSNIVIYLLELRQEKDETKIYRNFVKEITQRLRYPISIFFKYTNHQLEYSQSYLKGLAVLGKKLNRSLKGYIITEDSFIFKEIRKNNPYIYDRLPFARIVKQYNLQGKYAFIPVSTQHAIYGLLLVGDLGENAQMEHKDIEKLMLLANTVGLHLENLDVVSNLERLIHQRTSELELANKLLQTSNMEKDDMVKTVSHDLKAPLRNIIGLIDSINRKYKDELNKDIYDRLDRVNKNIEKELALIDNILTHFKTTEIRGEMRPIDMNKLLYSIKEDFSINLARKNIILEIPKNLPIINSHETILKHIFQNLIDNACKFLPERQIGNKIEIEYKFNDTSKTFMVADNGPGIPEKDLENIFKSFVQVKDDERGTGLGLAMAKNMLDKLGGTIYVESKIGMGAKFYIRMPHEIT